jgi:hypothetical protein
MRIKKQLILSDEDCQLLLDIIAAYTVANLHMINSLQHSGLSEKEKKETEQQVLKNLHRVSEINTKIANYK